MEYRPLGSSDINVSVFALGCSGIGGLNWLNGVSHGWPPIDENEVVEGVKAAIDAGVNHFDTADLYGNGESERRLGRAFRKLGLDIGDYVIASKTGYLKGSAEHPYHPFHIRHQCEQSLLNLGRDHLDLYYLHNAKFGDHDEWLEPAAETIQTLRKEGKIRLIGQSAYSHREFETTIPMVKPDVVQTRVNAMEPGMVRPGSSLPELMRENGITLTAFAPLAQGRLLGLFRPENPPQFGNGDVRGNNKGFTKEELEKLWRALGPVIDRFGDDPRTLGGLFFHAILDYDGVTAFLSGFQAARMVRENLDALAHFRPSKDDIVFVREQFAREYGPEA